MIPADPYADRGELCLPNLEACVTRAEVIFLLVAGAIRDVALAVEAKHFAVRIDDSDAVVVGVACLLEERDRDDDVELFRDLLEMRDGRVALERTRPGEEGFLLFATKIGALEEL